MIKLRDIGDNYYILDEKELAVVGQKTKKKYRIGDRIKIKVLRADIDKKEIDYKIITS